MPAKLQEGSRAPNAKHADNLATGGEFYSRTTYGKQYVQKVRVRVMVQLAAFRLSVFFEH